MGAAVSHHCHAGCALLGLGLGITWGVLRNESMAWILQDILGFFMLCSFLETIYITSLKVGGCILNFATSWPWSLQSLACMVH